jgi:hypothetical protein
VLDDGRKVTAEMVRALIPEELAKVKATVTAQGEATATCDQAAGIFREDVPVRRLSRVPDPAAVRSDGLRGCREWVEQSEATALIGRFGRVPIAGWVVVRGQAAIAWP